MKPIDLISTCIRSIYLERTNKEDVPNYWNYSWLKYITGINKDCSNGYSLLGEFVEYPRKTQIHRPGIYLMYDKELSTRGLWHWCLLFSLNYKGEINKIYEGELKGTGWAAKLWTPLEAWCVTNGVELEITGEIDETPPSEIEVAGARLDNLNKTLEASELNKNVLNKMPTDNLIKKVSFNLTEDELEILNKFCKRVGVKRELVLRFLIRLLSQLGNKRARKAS